MEHMLEDSPTQGNYTSCLPANAETVRCRGASRSRDACNKIHADVRGSER
jgi:hypothetical protein